MWDDDSQQASTSLDKEEVLLHGCLAIETHPTFLNVEEPTFFQLVTAHLGSLVVPLTLVVSAVVVTYVGPPAHIHVYVVADIVVGVFGIAWLFVALVLRMKRMLLQLGEQVPNVVGCDPELLDSLLSSDHGIHYVQSCVHNCYAYHRPVGSSRKEQRDDPLDFVKSEIASMGDDPTGAVFVDHTGTILWVNDAAVQYFRYERREMVGENIRMLMPSPYREQHDVLMAAYDRGCPRGRIVGHERLVPVVDKRGVTSSVAMLTSEHFDPKNPEHIVFSSRFDFGSRADDLSPALRLQRQMDNGITDVSECCSVLDSDESAYVVINAKGFIQYTNQPLNAMMGYARKELIGRNISLLMGHPHARRHNAALEKYMLGALAAREADEDTPSAVVGASRDLYALTKRGNPLRCFLTVNRIDHPSQDLWQSLFLGEFVSIHKQTLAHRSSFVVSSAATLSLSAIASQVNKVLPPLSEDRCTVVGVELEHLDLTQREALQHDYAVFLNMLANLCTKHRASLHCPVGSRVWITFNMATANFGHRSCAGAFLFQLQEAWEHATILGEPRPQLSLAADSGRYLKTHFGPTRVAFTESFDLCCALLRFGKEVRATHGFITATLYDELRYVFECRPVNVMTTTKRSAPSQGKPDIVVYELHALKELKEDEWLYQVGNHVDSEPLALWHQCWEALEGADPDANRAMDLLDQHLAQSPSDDVGHWMRSVLLSTQGLHHQNDNQPYGADIAQLECSLRYTARNRRG